jgi:trigger factor
VSVVLSVQDAGPCRKEVTIEVPAPAVEAETQRVAADYRRKARLPGFRPGKVPTKVVLQRYRKEIEGEVLERLVPRYWRQAEAEASLDALMAPSVESYEMVHGEPLKFVASVEVRPEFEVSGDRDFELPSSEVLVGEAELDDVLEQLRLEAAPWKPVDRESARGDRVRVRLRETPGEGAPEGSGADDEGEQPAEGTWSEIDVELANESVWEELRLALTGVKADQKTHFSRQEAPPTADDADAVAAASPPRHFELAVVRVEAKELPELDDDLAAALGGEDVETVDGLRSKLERTLFARKSAARRREREEKLLAQLIERHPITLPEGVVGQETENLVRDYAESLARAQVDLQQVDWRRMMESARPEAQRRVHSRLILDAIAAADEIEVTEPELEGALRSLARAQRQSPLTLRRTLDERGGLNPLRQQLRREKALRALLGEPPPSFADEAHDHDHDDDHDHDHDDHDHHRHD